MPTFKCRVLSIAVATLALLAGCSMGSESKTPQPSTHPATTGTSTEPSPSSESWSLQEARVDRIPRDPSQIDSGLPASFPADDSVLPDLLQDPPGQVRLTYHPREAFDDGDGWSSERVFFFGIDGSWRALDMGDLGLPDDTHPGWDTYGAGGLSPDGTRWAAPTRVGLVLLDLRTARAQVVRVPDEYTSSLHWHPGGGTIDVVRRSGRVTRTWSVDTRSLTSERAAYRLPIDGFADDGSVVTFSRRAMETVRTIHRGGKRTSDVVPMPYRHARLGGDMGPTRGLFGLNRGLLVVDGRSWAPQALLRLSPRDAVHHSRGWLDADSVWFAEESRGLLRWHVATGQVQILTRVRPGIREDSYWSLSLARDLVQSRLDQREGGQRVHE